MSRANEIIGDVFRHIAQEPKHRDIVGRLSLDFASRWEFYCNQCRKAWVISHLDLMEDETAARFVQDGIGPQDMIREMLKLPGVTRAQNAWDKLSDGYLDDD